MRRLLVVTLAAAGLLALPPANQPVAAQGSSRVQVGDATVIEGDTGGPNVMKLPVTLTEPAPSDVVVQWTLSSGTATGGSDFKARAKPSKTTIRAGKYGTLIAVAVYPDAAPEGTEMFEVELTQVLSGPAELGPRTRGTATILDDDPASEPVRVSIGDASIVEPESGSAKLALPFTLAQPLPTSAVEIIWTLTPGTATPVDDYKPLKKPKKTTIKAGKTKGAATMEVFGDVAPEGHESFAVTINSVNVVGGTDAVAVGRGTGTATILDGEPGVDRPLVTGSPRNFLGTGNDPADALPSSLHENFWLAASGPCASRENGDYLLTISDANYYFDPAPTNQNPGPTSGTPRYNRCTGSDAEGTSIDLTDGTSGDTYDPSGYFYGIEVPAAGAGQTVVVWGYDLSHCPGNSAIDSNNDGFRTTYSLRAPDATPDDPHDNPLLASPLTVDTSTGTSGQCSNTGSGYRNLWRQMFAIGNAQEGIYFVQVQTSDVGGGATELHGSNGFGLRASYGTTWDRTSSPCSTDRTETAIFRADCLRVFALDWMGVLANLEGTFPSFRLAGIGDQHAGRTLVVRLWDPGEGTLGLELLDPLGRSVDFSWQVVDLSGEDVEPTGGWSGFVDQPGPGACSSAPPTCTKLDLLGNDPLNTGRGWNPQPGPYRGSRSKYSDRLLELRVQLPTDLAAEFGAGRWWRVRYTMGVSSVNTDRTTWSVAIEDAPAPPAP